METARLLTRKSPTEMAEAMGFKGDRKTERYLKYERGERRPNVDDLKKFNEITGVSLDFIIADKPHNSRDLLSSAS